MSDSPDKRGGQDRTRINVHQDHELRDWAQKFGVKPSAVKDAVEAVGDRADQVEAHLRHLASQRAARGPHAEHAGSGNSLGEGRSGSAERKR